MKKLKNIQSQHSSFWLGKSSQELYGADVSGGGSIVKAIKMRSYQRAVSNFVKILTKEEIPVQFAGTQSYTNGKAITISADISNKNFDVAVGLALHEASHIILTDFNLIKGIRGISGWQFNILNWVEDRRIDAYVMSNAPGYKEYYNALYRHYFIYEDTVSKYLRSTQATEVTNGNYVRQIINMLHPEFKANALPGLQQIVDIIDTENISRLKSTKEVLDQVCLPVYEIIEQMVKQAKQTPNPDQEKLPSTNPQEGDETPADDVKPGENQESEEEEQTDETSTESTPEQVENEEVERIELTPDEMQEVMEAMDKMESFAKGELPRWDKKDADKNISRILNDIGDQDIEVYSSEHKGIKLLVHDMTRITPDWRYVEGYIGRDLAEGSIYVAQSRGAYIKAMEEGLAMGTSLGRKLQLVNEQRTLVTNRLKSGSMDKRRLAGLGYGIENVFNQITTEKHRKANLHISLDSSGSMQGACWIAALKTTVAIARAAQSSAGMITLQVSTRDTGRRKSAITNIIYDSRFNTLNTLLSNLSRCTVSSLTPEGLCFEGLLQAKKLIPGTKDVDSYFINVSDGEPYYDNYRGYNALKHTKKQVDAIKSLGISVLSFFVSESHRTTPSHSFTHMYGKDARVCTPDSLTGLAKALNSKFLEAKEVM
jgi:cobalamin biosynthesis protein CobT